MSKAHKFDCGDGTSVQLNSMQLMGLLQLPASNMSWPTYYALRRRGLVEGTSPQRRTTRGEAVVKDYLRVRKT